MPRALHSNMKKQALQTIYHDLLSKGLLFGPLCNPKQQQPMLNEYDLQLANTRHVTSISWQSGNSKPYAS